MTPAALQVLEGGRAPRGWEVLWAQDQWRQDELPHGDLASRHRGQAVLHFENLQQPWLKEAAKRWARRRLLAGTAPQSLACYLGDLRAFSAWLKEHAPELRGPAGLTRGVLEDFLLWVRTGPQKTATQQRLVGSLRMLLDEQRDDGLAGLPVGARILRTEAPRVDYRLPPQLEAGVFAQLIDPANLARLDCEQHRTIVLLLAFCGLRVSSVVTLPRGALIRGEDGHPYLRYANLKLRREAMLPIPPQLEQQLDRQERYLTDRYPEGTRWLLPSPPVGSRGSAKGGAHHTNHSTVRRILSEHVARSQIRTADGRLARVHPHLLRHHLASSLVNDGVPLPVIQKILDHASLEMTAHYARVHDETLRREVRRWHARVNIRGERIALPVDGPLGEAAWMKERLARAKQALPNGFCGLPLVQSCPHPNACLSCDSFLTDGSFRPVHQRQLEQTRRLLDDARQQHNVRLVELLQRDTTSLTRILEGIDALDADPPADARLDLRSLPHPEIRP